MVILILDFAMMLVNTPGNVTAVGSGSSLETPIQKWGVHRRHKKIICQADNMIEESSWLYLSYSSLLNEDLMIEKHAERLEDDSRMLLLHLAQSWADDLTSTVKPAVKCNEMNELLKNSAGINAWASIFSCFKRLFLLTIVRSWTAQYTGNHSWAE